MSTKGEKWRNTAFYTETNCKRISACWKSQDIPVKNEDAILIKLKRLH